VPVRAPSPPHPPPSQQPAAPKPRGVPLPQPRPSPVSVPTNNNPVTFRRELIPNSYSYDKIFKKILQNNQHPHLQIQIQQSLDLKH
jgi:hypothetical protein